MMTSECDRIFHARPNREEERVDALFHGLADCRSEIPVVIRDGEFPASAMGAEEQRCHRVWALACGKATRSSRGLTFSSIKPTLAFESFQTGQGGASATDAGLA